MAVIRQYNALGQARVDVPHIRGIEIAAAGDFDLLAGNILAGNQALVVSGFNILTTGAIGAAASSLTLNVQGGVLIHPLASESGSIFVSAADRTTESLSFSSNPRVTGSFTAGTTNFIGIDLKRLADSTTSDLVMFLDASSLVEKPRNVPLGTTLDYQITITTSDFSAMPGLCPIAKVVTDNSNNVTSIIDARNRLFRLGSGGSDPNSAFAFAWAAGRKENTAVGTDVFSGGDKGFASLKDWTAAMMTRTWEIGGGEFWYSPTADRNIIMIRTGTPFSNGEFFEWDGTNLHWQGIGFLLENSTATLNEVADQTTTSAGLTNLADGECIYTDVDRSTNHLRSSGTPVVALKAPYSVLGSSTIPGSRYIIAWRVGANIYTRGAWYFLGSSFAVASPSALGVVKLSSASPTPTLPTVIPGDASGFAIAAGVVPPTAGTELRLKNFSGAQYIRNDVATNYWEIVGNLVVQGIGIESAFNKLYFDSSVGTIDNGTFIGYDSGTTEFRFASATDSIRGTGAKFGEARVVRSSGDVGGGLKWFDTSNAAFRSPLQFCTIMGAQFNTNTGTNAAFNDLFIDNNTGALYQLANSTFSVYANVVLPQGAHVVGLGARFYVNNDNTMTAAFARLDKATDTISTFANATASVVGGGPVTSTVYKNGSGGTSKPVESDTSVHTVDKDANAYLIKLSLSSGTSPGSSKVYWVTVFYVMPELAF